MGASSNIVVLQTSRSTAAGLSPTVPSIQYFAGIKKDEKATGQVKAPSDAEAEANLDAKGKAALDKLRKLNGPAFDKEYVKGQLEGHQALLKIQEDFLKRGGPREQMNAAKLIRGMVKEHLALLSRLSKMV